MSESRDRLQKSKGHIQKGLAAIDAQLRKECPLTEEENDAIHMLLSLETERQMLQAKVGNITRYLRDKLYPKVMALPDCGCDHHKIGEKAAVLQGYPPVVPVKTVTRVRKQK